MKELSRNKVIIGLSGGVDSTAATLLLKKKGLEVIGFYFDVKGDNIKGRREAEKIAEKLNIKLITSDVCREFEKVVVDNFCYEYICGRTPNPCVICNPNIKFKKLIETANKWGAYYIATGHYARIEETQEGFLIKRGMNKKKDQSYMLYRLGQNVLSRLILPLGQIEDKEETRTMAKEEKLPNAEAADSQEICFIDEEKDNYVSFIEKRNYKSDKGNFVDSNGRVLGRHNGLINYTIGQRKGLGITFGKPVFVTKINYRDNTVTLGDSVDLFKKEVVSKDNFFALTSGNTFPKIYADEKRITAKIRYSSRPAPAVLKKDKNGKILTVFEEPQRAATPGQSIVFYDGDTVIGGGFIE